MFYLFVQNNSGGSFQYDTDAGIGVNVAFEANSEEEAIERAENVIYFDGVYIGRDCPCCGDRWSRWPYDSTETLEELYKCKYKNNWSDENYTMYVHMLDGTIIAMK